MKLKKINVSQSKSKMKDVTYLNMVSKIIEIKKKISYFPGKLHLKKNYAKNCTTFYEF